MEKLDREKAIGRMISYLDEEHRNNIHEQAFSDIANVFLDLMDEYKTQLNNYKATINGEDIPTDYDPNEKVKWVCNASMGHGKTTVLTCFLKWLVSERNQFQRIPILLVIRENGMAEQIFNELFEFKKGCITIVNAQNKQEVEAYVPYHQIVIITHSRLDNLSLGYGNILTYKIWEQYRIDGWSSYKKLDPKNFIYKRHRLLIIDEKPSFVNASVFDIDDSNNVLTCFNDLAQPFDLNVYESQMYRSYIMTLVAKQLSENQTSVTTSLIGDENSAIAKSLKRIIKKMKSHEENRHKNESLKTIVHFEKLLKVDEAGRIDDYQIRGNTGRKIIISEQIDYAKLGMNLLVLDGTAELNYLQYKGYTPKRVTNYNSYSRLHFHVDNINTSKYARSKKDYTTQKAIAKRIVQLKEEYKDLFVLPVKSDIEIYKNEKAIDENDLSFFIEKGSDETRPINLLNTTGKNELKERRSLYLTSMPKMNADHYKKIAIAIFGNEVDLSMSDEKSNNDWFNDKRLQNIYLGELYAEILQIIHRTALRIITSQDEIHIFIAYDDDDKLRLMRKPDGYSITPISDNLNISYFGQKANLHHYHVYDESMYKTDSKVKDYAEQIDKWIKMNVTFYNDLPKPISHIDKRKGGIGEKFRNWLKRNWDDDKEKMINDVFAEYGYKLYEQKDNYSEKTKYIDRIENINSRELEELINNNDLDDLFS